MRASQNVTNIKQASELTPHQARCYKRRKILRGRNKQIFQGRSVTRWGNKTTDTYDNPGALWGLVEYTLDR